MKVSILSFVLLLNLHIRGKELKENSINTKSESNPCQWGNDCAIQCLEGEYSTNSYIESMQSVFDEHDECHSRGIKLIVPNDYFPNKTLKSNWLPVNMKIIDLEVDFHKIGVIQQNAFVTGPFFNIKKLVIKNLWPEETLLVWTFTGLTSLENLIFVDAQLAVGWWYDLTISYKLLEVVKNTLNSLTLTESADSKNKSFSIQHMLGSPSATLSNLEYINIKYNLTTITSLSFTAITYVRVLDLSECYISAIEAQSFDNLNATLLSLNLERNKLVTLAEGIFKKLGLTPIIPNEISVNSGTTLTIYLSENPWHCGCKLMFAKDLLNEHSNFPGECLCKTPEEIENYPVREAEFCPYPVTTIRTTSISTETTQADSDNLIEKQCLTVNRTASNDKILIKSQMEPIQLTDKAGDVLVTSGSKDENLVLLWFGNDKLSTDLPEYQQSASIDCVSGFQNETVITNLNEQNVYTFCLLNMANRTVSPFDCKSYYHKGEVTEYKKVWFPESGKTLVISVTAIGLVSSIIIGTAIAAIFLWYNNDSGLIQKAENSSAVNQFGDREELSKQFRMNEGHINGSMEAVNSPPPLPPHPKLGVIDDEVYYATVKYINK